LILSSRHNANPSFSITRTETPLPTSTAGHDAAQMELARGTRSRRRRARPWWPGHVPSRPGPEWTRAHPLLESGRPPRNSGAKKMRAMLY